EIRSGDGGLRAAQAIRGGPRVRSRTPPADLEQPDLVHVRDAPASRSDLDQLDRRDADGQATALDKAPLPCCLEAVGGERLAVVDQGELGGGAAHVEGEDAGGGAIAIVAAEEGGGDGARRGAWLEHLPGRRLGLRHGGEAAAREHEEEGGGGALVRRGARRRSHGA